MTAIVRLRLPEDDAMFGGNRVFDAFEYAPAVVARGMAYISGQIGLRPDGTVPDTVREQIEWAFKRAEAILRRLGLISPTWSRWCPITWTSAPSCPISAR